MVETDGPPAPTVLGFVVQGKDNHGAISDRGDRCPFTELRTVQFEVGEQWKETALTVNEHLLMQAGVIQLTVNGLEVALSSGDVALMRAGAVRSMSCPDGAKAFLVRE